MLHTLKWHIGLNFRRVRYKFTETFTVYLFTLIWKLLIWDWISRYTRENCLYLYDRGFESTEWVPGVISITTGENPFQIGWYEAQMGPIVLCAWEHFEPGYWRLSIRRDKEWIYM